MNQTSAVAPVRPRVLQCITHLALGGAERIAFQLMRGLRAEYDFAVFTALDAIPDAVGVDMQRELGQAKIAHHHGTRAPCGNSGPTSFTCTRKSPRPAGR